LALDLELRDFAEEFHDWATPILNVESGKSGSGFFQTSRFPHFTGG